MPKIYVPYDYRTIMRGYIEIEVDKDDVNLTYEKLRSGDVSPEILGVKLPAEEVFKYDESIGVNNIMSEDKYNEDKHLRHQETTKGFKINDTRRET